MNGFSQETVAVIWNIYIIHITVAISSRELIRSSLTYTQKHTHILTITLFSSSYFYSIFFYAKKRLFPPIAIFFSFEPSFMRQTWYSWCVFSYW